MPNDLAKLRRLMKAAHVLKAQKPQFSFADMLRHAWYFERLRNGLSRGVVRFSFYKKDGTIREARGTLCPLLIPADKMPKGTRETDSPASSVAFFDLDKNEWRAFSIPNFIGFVDVWELNESSLKRPN
jgi:hypothetical protein